MSMLTCDGTAVRLISMEAKFGLPYMHKRVRMKSVFQHEFKKYLP